MTEGVLRIDFGSYTRAAAGGSKKRRGKWGIGKKGKDPEATSAVRYPSLLPVPLFPYYPSVLYSWPVNLFPVSKLNRNLSFRVRQIKVSHRFRNGEKLMHVVSAGKHLLCNLPGAAPV